MNFVDKFLKTYTKSILGDLSMIEQSDINYLSIEIEFLKELEKKDILSGYKNISLTTFKDIKIPNIRLAIDEISSSTPHISFTGENISMGLSRNKVSIEIGEISFLKTDKKEKEKIFLQKKMLQNVFSDINLILGAMISEFDEKIEEFDFSVNCIFRKDLPKKSIEETFIKKKPISELENISKTAVSGIEIKQIENSKKDKIAISVTEEYSSNNVSISFNNLISDLIEKANNVWSLLEGE